MTLPAGRQLHQASCKEIGRCLVLVVHDRRGERHRGCVRIPGYHVWAARAQGCVEITKSVWVQGEGDGDFARAAPHPPPRQQNQQKPKSLAMGSRHHLFHLFSPSAPSVPLLSPPKWPTSIPNLSPICACTSGCSTTAQPQSDKR